MTMTRKKTETGLSSATPANGYVELSEHELDGVVGGYTRYSFGGTYSSGKGATSTNIIAILIG